MSKMNYYACDRKLAERLTSFVNDKKVDLGSIQYYYDYQINQVKNMISSQDNLRGSIFSDDDIDSKILELESQITLINEKKKEALSAINKWEWDDNDKKLEKLSKKSNVTELELACGITEWFRAYNYSVSDMDYVYDIVHTCFGIKEKSDKGFVRDILKGKDADATMRRTDSLRTFYAKIATDAMVAGTVKIKDLSEVVRETYEKEVSERKIKKAEKKAEKQEKVSAIDYTKMTYKELQALCKEKGLKASGKTEELIERLAA